MYVATRKRVEMSTSPSHNAAETENEGWLSGSRTPRAAREWPVVWKASASDPSARAFAQGILCGSLGPRGRSPGVGSQLCPLKPELRQSPLQRGPWAGPPRGQDLGEGRWVPKGQGVLSE